MNDRRMFLKQVLAGTAVAELGLDPVMGSEGTGGAAMSSSRSGVASYDATVPDTLDLAEHCRLALRGVANNSDPDMYGQTWFTANFASSQPFYAHGPADAVCTPKVAESFPLLRFVTGVAEFEELERFQMDNLVANIYPKDGLYYSVYKPNRPWHSGYVGSAVSTEDWSQIGADGRMMRAMMTWKQRDGDSKWDALIRNMARGMGKIAIHKGDYAYYPDGGHSAQFAYPKSGWLRTDEPQGEAFSVEGSVLDSIGHPIYALSRWYQMSGDKKALELARKVTNFVLLPKMWGGLAEEVGVDGSAQGHFHSHMHGHMMCLRAVLFYGMVAQDSRVIEFVRRSYEGFRRYMIPRIGWLGANGVGDGGIGMEACGLADVIALGIRLSDAGVGDYWDDVDAVVRNMLVEQQLTDVAKLRAVASACGWRGQSGGDSPDSQAKGVCYRDMPDRMLGVFHSSSLPNHLPGGGVMGCCTGNAPQALYFAWDGALRWQGESATVNLLVNRASPVADVDSFLPYQGKVVIRNKTARRLFVRLPSWVDRSQLKVLVGSKQHEPALAGNYLLIDGVVPSDQVLVTFPVPESRATYTAHHRVWRKEKDYTFVFRGSTVVDVEPKETGRTNIPIFDRKNMRQGEVPMRQVVRNVQDREALGW